MSTTPIKSQVFSGFRQIPEGSGQSYFGTYTLDLTANIIKQDVDALTSDVTWSAKLTHTIEGSTTGTSSSYRAEHPHLSVYVLSDESGDPNYMGRTDDAITKFELSGASGKTVDLASVTKAYGVKHLADGSLLLHIVCEYWNEDPNDLVGNESDPLIAEGYLVVPNLPIPYTTQTYEVTKTIGNATYTMSVKFRTVDIDITKKLSKLTWKATLTGDSNATYIANTDNYFRIWVGHEDTMGRTDFAIGPVDLSGETKTVTLAEDNDGYWVIHPFPDGSHYFPIGAEYWNTNSAHSILGTKSSPLKVTGEYHAPTITETYSKTYTVTRNQNGITYTLNLYARITKQDLENKKSYIAWSADLSASKGAKYNKSANNHFKVFLGESSNPDYMGRTEGSGSDIKPITAVGAVDLRNENVVTLATWAGTTEEGYEVSHDEDGKCQLKFTGQFWNTDENDIGSESEPFEVTGVFDCPTIEDIHLGEEIGSPIRRVYVKNTGADAEYDTIINPGDRVYVEVNPRKSSYYHVGVLSITNVAQELQTATFTKSGYVDIPLSWNSYFTDTNELWGVFSVQTYTNSSKTVPVGNPVNSAIRIQAKGAEITTGTFVATGPSTLPSGVYVQGRTQLTMRCVTTATIDGTTIHSIKFNGIEQLPQPEEGEREEHASEDTGNVSMGTITASGTITNTIEVTDSLGTVTTKTSQIYVYPYEATRLSDTVIYRVSSPEDKNYSSIFVKSGAVYYGCGTNASTGAFNNGYTMEVSYREINEESWSTPVSMEIDKSVTIGDGALSLGNAYVVRLTITDTIGASDTYEVTLRALDLFLSPSSYLVYCDGYILHDPTLADSRYILETATIKDQKNSSSTFTFSMAANHMYYNSVYRYRSVIEVYYQRQLIFKGRVIDDSYDWNNTRTVTCESFFGFLNDTIIGPYDYSLDTTTDEGSEEGSAEESEEETTTSQQKLTIGDFFRWVITQHNTTPDAEKRFTIGDVSVKALDPVDKETEIAQTFVSSDYTTTLSTLNEKLLDVYGGYLIVEYANGQNIISYVDNVDNRGSLQAIRLSTNILDYSLENFGSEVYTAIIPLGARKEADASQKEERVTIESVTSDGRNYVYDEEAVQDYGYIFTTKTWDDITDPATLKATAENELSKTSRGKSTMTLTAFDLSLADPTMDIFSVLDHVDVEDEFHNVVGRYLIEEKETSLTDPASNTVTIGDERTSISEFIAKKTSDSKNIISNYIINEAMIKWKTTTSYSISEIQQTENNISSQVSNVEEITGYLSNPDSYDNPPEGSIFAKIKKEVSTEVNQTAENISFEFDTKYSQKITDLTGAVTDLQDVSEDVKAHIDFSGEDGVPEIALYSSRDGGGARVRITNEKLSFDTATARDVAYMTADMLHIENADILTDLNLGQWQIVHIYGNHISLKWKG